MGFLGSPVSSFAPNPNDITATYAKNCLQVVICSTSCPRWCLPSPDDDNSGKNTTFPPLIIALITILGTIFLVMVYYCVFSKYCKRRRDHQETQIPVFEEENLNHLMVVRSGLDDGSIESITVFKYRRGDGLVESTDCAVCLSEFKEEESLRLLPNCSHAFHINCIDAWLKSHSNCPLCRANGDPFLPQPPSNQVYAV